MRKQEKEELALLNELARRRKEEDPHFGEELIKDKQVKEFLKDPDLNFLLEKDLFIVKPENLKQYQFLKYNAPDEAKELLLKDLSERQKDPKFITVIKDFLEEKIQLAKDYEEKNLQENQYQLAKNEQAPEEIAYNARASKFEIKEKINDEYFSLSTSDILDKLKLAAVAEQEQQEKAIQNMNRGLDPERQFK